jgi:hypothetical protein
MSGEFTDPLHDPRFPDRPTTQDFWRLSEISMQHDGRVIEGGESISAIVNEIVDYDTLLYMARHRLGTAFQIDETKVSPRMFAMFLSAYIDAFVKGAEFVRRGGHRE